MSGTSAALRSCCRRRSSGAQPPQPTPVRRPLPTRGLGTPTLSTRPTRPSSPFRATRTGWLLSWRLPPRGRHCTAWGNKNQSRLERSARRAQGSDTQRYEAWVLLNAIRLSLAASLAHLSPNASGTRLITRPCVAFPLVALGGRRSLLGPLRRAATRWRGSSTLVPA